MQIILPKISFDKSKSHVIYNYEQLGDYYLGNEILLYHFFIKEISNHENVLKKLLAPFASFKFISIDEGFPPMKEKFSDSDYSWLFASYKVQREPSIINWSNVGLPMKRNRELNQSKIHGRNIDDYVYR